MPKATRSRHTRALKGKEKASDGYPGATVSENNRRKNPFVKSLASKTRVFLWTATTECLPSLAEFKAQKEAIRVSMFSQLQSSQAEGSSLPSLAAYKAQKEAQRETDITNKMAEAATVQRASDARMQMLSKNTVNQYLRYERHWVVSERPGHG